MKTQDQVWSALVDSNPVPDVDVFGRQSVDEATHLATLQQGSSEVTQLSTKQQETQKRNRAGIAWLAAAAVVALVGAAIIFLNQGNEEQPPATQPVPTTLAQPSTTVPQPTTTVVESALADVPIWTGTGRGQWTPAKSTIPFAFTNADDWNSLNLSLTEERFTICPSPDEGRFSMCHLASVAVLFLEQETIEETRDFLAAFDGAELGEEEAINIDDASGIRFEFAHEVPPLIGQAQGELDVPAAADSGGSEVTPLGEGPQGRSVISIVDVDGVIVTLAFQGRDTSRGAPEEGFETYEEAGLAIIDSIIWGAP